MSCGRGGERLGSQCEMEFWNGETGCLRNSVKGICVTWQECLDRGECSDINSEIVSNYDQCVCDPETVAGVPVILFVAGATAFGLLFYMIWASKLDVGRTVHAPMAIGTFYSGGCLAFTIITGHDDDFFTAFGQNYLMLLLAVFTVIPAVLLVAVAKLDGLTVAFYFVFIFCVTAGYFTFCLGVVILTVLGFVLFIVMSITIRCLRSSWYHQNQPQPGDVGGPSAGDYLSAVVVFVVRRLFGILAGSINFVMQVGLLSFTIGDMQGVRQEVKEHFIWTFDFSMRVPGFPSECSWLMAQVTEASVVPNNAAEEAGLFLLNYSNLWTPSLVTAFSSVGVFEIMVVAAVFGIVLSDCLLILAPREGSGEIAKHVVELASRVFLYVVQVLVSVSHALILALTFVQPIERPPLSDRQQNQEEFAEPVSFVVTNFYVGLVLLCALFILLKLWSGEDGGLQNIAPTVLRMNGVDVKDVKTGKPCPMAFVCAFFGVWPQCVKTALEVEERCSNFRLGEEEVMLATVNALSFPIYIVPFGAVVAKLGEYMNQCPIYVAGRDFHPADVVLSMTYAAEYVLVLLTCSELLDSAEQGYPTGEDAVANAEDEWIYQTAVCWLCLTLLRALATCIRDHVHCGCSPVGPEDPEKQCSGSLGVVSCQSSKVCPEKQGTGSLGVSSYQSSTGKAEDVSQDVKEIEPTTSEAPAQPMV